MNNLVSFSFFISLLFTACHKDPPVEPKPAVPLQDIKAYSYFKTGTYWIYKDSATSAEDSVYVYADTAYSYYNSGNPIVAAGNYMYYDCRAHSYYDTYNYYYQIDMGYYGSEGSVGVKRIRTKPGDYVGETFLMSNRFEKGESVTLYTGTGTSYFKIFYDSLSVMGKYYKKVVKFNDTRNASEYESSTNFYIAKNIGIVRKEKLDTITTWNLIRYRIIQ